MWSLRWHFTNKSVAGAPYSIKRYSYSLSHSRTLRWRVRWLKQWRLEVAAELQQRWRRTNRRRKSIPRSSSSHRKGSITQRGASCGRYDQRRRRSTPKTPTWTYVGSQVRVSARYDGAVPIRQRYAKTHNQNWILSGTFSQCSSRRSVNWKLRATPSFCKPTAYHTVLTPRASAGFGLGGQCQLAAWGDENF